MDTSLVLIHDSVHDPKRHQPPVAPTEFRGHVTELLHADGRRDVTFHASDDHNRLVEVTNSTTQGIIKILCETGPLS